MSTTTKTDPRAAAMRLFALTAWPAFEALTTPLTHQEFVIVRGPETGLVMMRGRIGGTGDAFNVGETTVTRCTVKLASGIIGHSYVQGRNGDHAKRAALCDAVFQESPEKLAQLLKALTHRLEENRRIASSKAAATKVDFFTMVRGDA
jgi:alpha-D-ribose 1-methylphosphonate 5-triphosphate synthase subunit PhnG